ncbi:HNH endonuclease [Paenarthrobacter sp. NPDC089714]|uniref:HNH endonuclease n=1 Tax=Paenarthrobacter sp. NPDC089714 TaxID=3364377 RepID=UPI0038184C5A
MDGKEVLLAEVGDVRSLASGSGQETFREALNRDAVTLAALPSASVRSAAGPSAAVRNGADPATVATQLIDQLRILEDMKSAISGLQAKIAVAFDHAQRQVQAERGVPASERGNGVAAQIALARRESPNRGSRLLGLAKALVTEMPHTMAALDAGQLNEWRATLLVKETACLSAEDRCAVDEELAADMGTFEGVGDRSIIAAAKAAAYRRDPRSVTQRAARAASERHVGLRPAPDTMAILTALLPVAHGVAAYKALTEAADSARSTGDERSRGQVMADTLVERLTGTPGGISKVEVQLVMTDRTLFQGDSEPARLEGYGIVPGGWARELVGKADPAPPGECSPPLAEAGAPVRHPGQALPGEGGPPLAEARAPLRQPGHAPPGECGLPLAEAGAPLRQLGQALPGECGPPRPSAGTHESSERCRPPSDPAFEVYLRRLFAAPANGELVAMDSRARLFPGGMRRFIEARDALCRTPYCDAPIRHIDHIVPWHAGGPTTLRNGAGLCEQCNHTKENPGWTAKPPTSGQGAHHPCLHTLEVTTPTGHTYRSKAPPLPGHGPALSPAARLPGGP